MAIKKLILYTGTQKIKEEKKWGIPFKFIKNKPQWIEEKFANLFLNNPKLYKEVDAFDRLHQVILEKGKHATIKILLIRYLGGLGDVLMNTPVFKALKENIPNAHITYTCLSEFIPIIQNNPYLDAYFAFNKDIIDTDSYDVNIDITRCCAKYEVSAVNNKRKVDLHRTDIYLNHAGFSTSDKRAFYKTTKEEQAEAKLFLNGKRAIGFQMRSAAPIRDWDIKNYKELAKLITKKWEDMYIMIFDKENTFGLIGGKVIPVINEPIRKVAALIEQCEAMVTVDSGLMHLTGALSKPQVALFGNIESKCRTAYYPETKVMQLYDMPCVPCWRNDCVSRMCMKNITPEMVMNKLVEIVETPKSKESKVKLKTKRKSNG